MTARLKLLENDNVKQALEDLWSAANCVDPSDAIIDKQEYAIMHRKIVLHLQPMATPSEAMEAMEEDWQRDTLGEKGLSKQRFVISWFELADLWTESIEADDYEDFLTDFLAAVLVQRPDGGIEWQRDSEIIRDHFVARKEAGKKVTNDCNMPLCLSRWHRHLKNQAVERAAAMAADKAQAGIDPGTPGGPASRRGSMASVAASRRGSCERRGSVACDAGGRRGSCCAADAGGGGRRGSCCAADAGGGRRGSCCFPDAGGGGRRGSVCSCSCSDSMADAAPPAAANGASYANHRSSFVDACYDHAAAARAAEAAHAKMAEMQPALEATPGDTRPDACM